MGYSRWNDDDWKGYSAKTTAKPAAAIFTSRGMHADLNPLGVVMRESRDSDLNPLSTAIIVASDVTGSMGSLADYFVKTGLGTLFTEILDRKPVTDPHLMVMAMGDATCDSAPLQVSQFEADITIANHLEKVYVEHGGGGNQYESYELPWYFAAYHTSIDCFEKRGKKGYLFTIGDESASPGVIGAQIKEFIGDTPQADMTLKEMFEIVSKMYHVYHIIVAESSHYRSYKDRVKSSWTDVIGQNAIVLSDHTKLSEVITSIIEVNEGADVDTVAASWSGDTSLVVSDAISTLKGVATVNTADKAVVRF